MIRRAVTHERAMLLEAVDDEPSNDQVVESSADRKLLERALAQLPLEQRLVLELTYYLDHSCEEIADIMECPVNTVKTRMFHARRKLRVLLGDSHAAGGP